MHPWVIRNLAEQRVADWHRECSRRSSPGPRHRPARLGPQLLAAGTRLAAYTGLAAGARRARPRRTGQAGTGALGALR